jgi:ectoine hydroxylase-related dioxygenase (phytanoyl-CoA dioxygenase family)
MTNYELNELDTNGYLIIRNFLSDDEVLHYKTIFQYDKSIYGKNYREVDISVENKIIPSVKEKFEQFMASLNAATNRNINFLSPVIDVLRTENVNLPWHQEHEGYFMYQNPKNHLRMWIPLVKSSPEIDGIEMIKHADLKSNANEFFHKYVLDTGAKFFKVEDDKTTVVDRENDITTVENINLEDYITNTMTMPGDAVIFRGDCVHRTQPNSKNRMAIAFKLCDDTHVICKDKFMSGGDTKHKKFTTLPHYKPYFDIFETRETATFKELNDIFKEVFIADMLKNKK